MKKETGMQVEYVNRRLRTAMRVNAVFCAASGLVAIADSTAIADAFGIGRPWIFVTVGGTLMIYAAALGISSSRRPIRDIEARIAVTLDTGWVVGSALLVAFGGFVLTREGRFVIALLALAVLVLDIWQARSLSGRRQGPGKPVLVRSEHDRLSPH